MIESDELNKEFIALLNLSVNILKDLYTCSMEEDKIYEFKEALRYMILNNKRILSIMEDQKNVKLIWETLDSLELALF